MKNKKIYLLIIISVILLVFIGIIFYINKTNDNINYNELNSSSDELNQKMEEDNYIQTFNIKSTPDNPIKIDDIEATNIEITDDSGKLQIVTTLKNNSNEDCEGFFISIALLDENGNTLTTISKNSSEIIPANGELTLTNSVVGIEKKANFLNAKIETFEKSAIKNNLENVFNTMNDMAIPESK